VILELRRHTFTDTATLGCLYIDGLKFCDTLEDTDRHLEVMGEHAKIAAKTAIPRGKYQVTISMSPRFKKLMIALLDVPYFTGIRMHSGNTVEHTEGCPLLGIASGQKLVESKMATNQLLGIIDAELKTGRDIFITVC
jgi:hypothetical protein